MKRPLSVLPDIHIASPCPVSWDAMPGDDRVRHCSQCDQSVYTLTELTAGEVAALFADATPCVRLYRRADGTVITRDCPAGRALRMRRAARRAVVALASWFGVVLAAGCQKESKCTATMGVPLRPSSERAPAVEPDPEK